MFNAKIFFGLRYLITSALAAASQKSKAVPVHPLARDPT
jgi:predicted transporter